MDKLQVTSDSGYPANADADSDRAPQEVSHLRLWIDTSLGSGSELGLGATTCSTGPQPNEPYLLLPKSPSSQSPLSLLQKYIG